MLHSVSPHLSDQWRLHLMYSYVPRWFRPSYRGKKTTFNLSAFCMPKKGSFYQDRLGTNRSIREALKRERYTVSYLQALLRTSRANRSCSGAAHPCSVSCWAPSQTERCGKRTPFFAMPFKINAKTRIKLI